MGGCRSPTFLSLPSFLKWMLLSLKMRCVETTESLLPPFSDGCRVLATVHSWNSSWNTGH